MDIKEPFELMALLAAMKSALQSGQNIAVHERDIAAVQDAVSVIKYIRSIPPSNSHRIGGK